MEPWLAFCFSVLKSSFSVLAKRLTLNSEIRLIFPTLRGNACFFLIIIFSLCIVFIRGLNHSIAFGDPGRPRKFFVFSVVFFLQAFSFIFPFFNRVYASPVEYILVVKKPSDRFRCVCLSGSLYLTDQCHRCIESDGCNAKRLPFNNSWKTGKARFV